MEIRKFIPDQPPIDRRGKVGIRILEGSKEKKTELSEAERMEQERKDYFDFSGDCGRSAYAELTNDEDGIKYPHLENTVKHGALYFGHTNFKPENPVNHPTEYIDAFKKFIEQSQEDVAKADPIKPEEIEDFTNKVKQSAKPALIAQSVIIATGAAPITLGVKGEKEFWAKGVSACAVCDAAFFKDKIVFVVGGGDSAMEDSTALTKFASQVHIIHRRDSFKASKIMQERVLNNPKITVHWNSTLEEIMGNNIVEKVRVNQSGEVKEYDAQGVFMAIGHRPMNLIFTNQVELDSHGYVVTGQSATKQGVQKATQLLTENGLVSYPTMSSVEGVFAGGDGVDVRYKQAITAAGQGCAASLDAERWLESQE